MNRSRSRNSEAELTFYAVDRAGGEGDLTSNSAPVGRFDASAVLEHMADGFLALDAEWTHIFVNSAAEALLGVSRADLLGRNHWQSRISLAGTLAEAELRRVMRERVVASFDMELAGKWYNVRTFPLPERALALRLRDVTDQRLAAERLQLALDSTGLGLWDHDVQTGRLFWDDRTRALFGMAAGMPVEGLRTFGELLHPQDREWVLAAYRAALAPAGTGVFDSEFQVQSGSAGAPRWLLARGRVIFDRTGRPSRMLGTLLDITDRKHAEHQLQENEERLRLAIDATGLGMWDHDLGTDRRIWSGPVRTLLGLPAELEPTQALLRRLIHPADEPLTAERYRAAFDPEGDGEYRHEFRVRRYGDGAERWLAAQGRVLFNAARRPVRALGIVQDVTEAKRAEASLRSENEWLEMRVAERTHALEAANRDLADERARLGAILEQMPFGVLVASVQGSILFQNAAARRLMGQDVSDVREWRDFAGFGSVHPDGTPLAADEYALVRAARDGISTDRKQQPFVTGDGRRVVFEISAAPVRDARGEIVLGVLVLEDITSRLDAEEALRRAQRFEAVGQLTGGVAHDFNNLLTAILGNLEMLGRRAIDSRSAALVANAARAADRGANLTAQLLAFARKQRLQVQALDMGQLVQSMATLLRGTLGGTIQIDFIEASDLWPAVADPTQLELLVLNLAINARDAMAAGGRLTIRTENAIVERAARPEDPPPGQFVALTVSDTGTGMEPAVLARVFEPFFTTKEVGKGSGLGLPQVLGVAQQLGGGVRIASRPGVGTDVTVYLPRARPDHAGPPSAVDRAEPPSLHGLTILLVDDDEDVREITADLLQELGAGVVQARTGVEALQRVDSHFDVVLLDFAMPLMSGAEIGAHIRSLYPRLPIVIVTGHGDALDLPDAVMTLHKPFQAGDLARTVRQAARSRR